MLTQTLRIGAVLEPSLNSLSHFHAREKNSPFCHCAFHISIAQAKKTRQGLDSPSNFRAHEKTVHSRTVFLLIFVYEWQKSHNASTFDSCRYFTLVLS